MTRCSHVTMFRSRFLSTQTISRGSLHSFQYLATVIISFMPFIWNAPSPTQAIATRSGKANLAAITYGTPGPIVARFPESEPMMPSWNFRSRVPARRRSRISGDDAAVGQLRRQLPEHALGIDRLRAGHGALLDELPPLGDFLFDLLAPAAVGLALQHRDERAQRLPAVADEIDFHRIADRQHAAVDVDLHAARFPFLRQKPRIGKARADHQQRVAFVHQRPARLRAEKSDGTGDERQRVRQRGFA